jgi:hypothetical protein
MVEENNNIKPNEKYIIKIQSYYRGYNCRKIRDLKI